MVKKIAALAGAGALLLSVAGPALAWGWWWGGSRDVAVVNNGASAIADTGGNSQDAMAQKGGDVDADGSRYINTGNANAEAKAVVVANTHVGCGPCAVRPRHKDFAKVNNGAEAVALTGYNSQDAKAQKGGDVDDADGNRTIVTGNAWSRAKAYTIVNTHLSIGGWPINH